MHVLMPYLFGKLEEPQLLAAILDARDINEGAGCHISKGWAWMITDSQNRCYNGHQAFRMLDSLTRYLFAPLSGSWSGWPSVPPAEKDTDFRFLPDILSVFYPDWRRSTQSSDAIVQVWFRRITPASHHILHVTPR